MNVMLTRDAFGIARWKPRFIAAGIRVYEFPTIKIQVLPAYQSFEINLFEWIIFTSANGVRSFFESYANILNVFPETLKVAAVGLETKQELEQYGISVTFVPSLQTSAALAAELPSGAHEHALIIRGNLSLNLNEMLQTRGILVTELTTYETQVITDPSPDCESALEQGAIEAIVFASPSAVAGFCKRLSSRALTYARTLPAISIGPTTSRTLESASFTTIREAKNPSLDGIIQTLVY